MSSELEDLRKQVSEINRRIEELTRSKSDKLKAEFKTFIEGLLGSRVWKLYILEDLGSELIARLSQEEEKELNHFLGQRPVWLLEGAHVWSEMLEVVLNFSDMEELIPFLKRYPDFKVEFSDRDVWLDYNFLCSRIGEPTS